MVWIRRGILVSGVAGICLAGGLFLRAKYSVSPYEGVADARTALEQGNAAAAHEIADRVLRGYPQHVPALMVAGEAATKLGRTREAIAYYERVPNDGSRDAIVSQGAAGDLLFSRGHLAEAESRFRAILKLYPEHTEAHRRLATLLTIEGRRWEARPHLFELLRQEQFRIAELVLLGNVDELYDDTELLKRARTEVPNDPISDLGFAKLSFHRGEMKRTAELLRNVIAGNPNQLEAQALLGRLYLHDGAFGEIQQWEGQLPPGSDSRPDIWFVRGAAAEKSGQPEAAIRCYWEAARRHPDHLEANYRLSQLLIAREEHELAKLFLKRSDQLNELRDTLHRILFNDRSVDTMTRAAQLTESMGRLWEAWGWHNAVVFFHPTATQAAQDRDRIKQQLRRDMPLTVAAANPALRVDYSSYPLPRGNRAQATADHRPDSVKPMSDITFVDFAPKLGLDFSYYNGTDPNKPGFWIYQTMGGGVAVLDFNCDNWPDLYFVQSCDWPPKPDQTRFADQLYMNLGGHGFQRVTDPAQLGDKGYGQGVTVGDLDNDGFPDLYVANIGQNRLYRNNGDGTFSDMTAEAGLTDQRWTTSCMLADVNGDQLPDLYDVNYLAGQAPFQRICDPPAPRACKPNLFAAEQDQMFLNIGDGTFQDVTVAAGITQTTGKGLGIVGADFTGAGRLDLFIANDTDGNFLLINQSASTGGVPSFVDRGAENGCAFSGDGHVQACMGVAAGDANGDQLLDLFATNFYNEPNTLYLQQPGGYFEDRTQEAGLRDPSLRMLGFGTQFLDADLDGWPDLVVANGHIDGFQDTPWKMRPQFFRHRGRDRFAFVELAADSLGPYFQRECLGRSLARLDWNRDGREDFVVSHLDVPASLVTNSTPNCGHFLVVRLSGVVSNRDAIGTVVEVTAGNRKRVMQLTAGDGYMASNQRQLVFGLGTDNRVDALQVRWPSGVRQTFHNIDADAELLIVETVNQLFASEKE